MLFPIIIIIETGPSTHTIAMRIQLVNAIAIPQDLRTIDNNVLTIGLAVEQITPEVVQAVDHLVGSQVGTHVLRLDTNVQRLEVTMRQVSFDVGQITAGVDQIGAQIHGLHTGFITRTGSVTGTGSITTDSISRTAFELATHSIDEYKVCLKWWLDMHCF